MRVMYHLRRLPNQYYVAVSSPHYTKRGLGIHVLGGCKNHVARSMDTKQILYGKVETNGMATGFSNYSLRLSGRSAGVDDV